MTAMPSSGDSLTGDGSPEHATIRLVGLFLGPVLGLLGFLALPDAYETSAGTHVAFEAGGRATIAVMIWMATWWLTECIDVAATALLPLALFPILGISDMKSTAEPYASDLIFLFMGGFLLAISMQRWNLDQRIAVVTLRRIGSRPRSVIAGFMLVTAVLSAFVSNTATAAMMLPIAMSVIVLVRSNQSSDSQSGAPKDRTRNFEVCLLLALAYAATLGGIATIVGTPPNLLLVGFIKEQIAPEFQADISFAQWLMVGLPVSIILLPVTWLLLTFVLFRIGSDPIEGVDALLEERAQTLGPMQSGEWITMIVFFATATLWILRPLLEGVAFGSGDNVFAPFAGLTDPGIAMTGALLLFVIPVQWRPRRFTMTWHDARSLPWGILLLFGGGLSLAAAVRSNGVAEFLGAQMTIAQGLPPLVIVLIVVTMIVFFTELTSNTATTATLLPILAALAPAFDMHPYLLVVPAAIGASCAFMMPVATPPNAIVFGSGRLTIPQMCRAGLLLNLASILVVTALSFTLVRTLLP